MNHNTNQRNENQKEVINEFLAKLDQFKDCRISIDIKRGLPTLDKQVCEFFELLYKRAKEVSPKLGRRQFLKNEIAYFKEKQSLLTEYQFPINAIVEVLDNQLSVENLRIGEMQYIVDNERGGLVWGFIQALDNEDTKTLAKSEIKLLNFIKWNSKDFDFYPIVYSQLDRIIEHPYFRRENKEYGNYREIKKGIESILKIDADKNTRSIKSPEKKLFCGLVNDSQLLLKDIDESASKYCERVCKKYKLGYTDRVRQYFSTNVDIKKNDNTLKKVMDLIVPTLPEQDKQRIETYVNGKLKLYA